MRKGPEPKTPARMLAELEPTAARLQTGQALLDYLNRPYGSAEEHFHSPQGGELILRAIRVLQDNPRRADRTYDREKLKLRDSIGFRGVYATDTVLYWSLLFAIKRLVERFGEEHRGRWIEDYPVDYATEFVSLLLKHAKRYAPWEERRELRLSQPEYGNGASFQKRGHGSR